MSGTGRNLVLYPLLCSWIPTPKGLVPGLGASHWPPLDFMVSIGLSDFLRMWLGSEKEANLGNKPILSAFNHPSMSS